MSAKVNFKATFISSVLLLGVYIYHAHANSQHNDAVINEHGIKKKPVCDFDVSIQSALKNAQDTGERATTPEWDMSLYYNAANSRWTLLGKSKAPGSSSLKSCWLSTGNGDYREQKWYREFFVKKISS